MISLFSLIPHGVRVLGLIVICACVVFAGGFAVGWQKHTVSATTSTTTEQSSASDTTSHAAVQTQIVYRDRIVTVTHTITKAADGTTSDVTTTKTEEKAADKATSKTADTTVHNEQQSSGTTSTTGSNLPLYSLGIAVSHSYADWLPPRTPIWQDASVQFGYRVLGPAWVELQIAPIAHTAGLGLRWEW